MIGQGLSSIFMIKRTNYKLNVLRAEIHFRAHKQKPFLTRLLIFSPLSQSSLMTEDVLLLKNHGTT